MKRRTLNTKEIQDVCLHVMKHIHQFCVENNIKYTLHGGSLIGAIRHKGFIPWDDDLDIAMPRPDYDRFVELYNDSEEFKLFTPERGNSDKLYARLCEIKRTESWVSLPWHKGSAGVWIDIFPINALADDFGVFKKDICRLKQLELLSYKVRSKNIPITVHNSIIRNIKTIIRKIQYSTLSVRDVVQKHMALAIQYDYSKSKYAGQTCYLDFPLKEHTPKEWYENVILYDFEDTQFYVVKEYDKLLSNYYGDYMQLPPEENRRPTHSALQGFYWK